MTWDIVCIFVYKNIWPVFMLTECLRTTITYTKHLQMKSSVLSKVILIIRNLKLSQSTWIQALFSLREKADFTANKISHCG